MSLDRVASILRSNEVPAAQAPAQDAAPSRRRPNAVQHDDDESDPLTPVVSDGMQRRKADRESNLEGRQTLELAVQELESAITSLPAQLTVQEVRMLRKRINDTLDDHVGRHLQSFTQATDNSMHEGPLFSRHLVHELLDRSVWLAFLLLIQSFSSIIMEQYEDLISQNIVLTFFMTMLIGAGGNSGNQSAVMVIRGLAIGTVRDDNQGRIVCKQAAVGIMLGMILVCIGFLRVYVFGTDVMSAITICVSLWLIIIVAVIVGSVLPLLLNSFGMDPAHAGAAIQVFMDIVGVWIMCKTGSLLLSASSSGASRSTASSFASSPLASPLPAARHMAALVNGTATKFS